MASVNDGFREKQFYRVYTRKARGLKKDEKPSEDENGSIEAPSRTVIIQKGVNSVVEDDNSSGTLAREDRGSVVIDKNLTEAPSETTTHAVNPDIVDKKPIEATSRTQTRDDVNAVVVGETSIKAPSQTPVEEDVDSFVADKNSIEVHSENPIEEHHSTVVVDKTIEVPSETPVQEDADTAVVDRKSVEVPTDSQAQEDVDVDVVDKHSVEARPDDFDTVVINNDSVEPSSHRLSQVEAPSQQEYLSTDVTFQGSIEEAPQTVAQEDISTIVVEKKSIEVPMQEGVNVVVVDSIPNQASQPLVNAPSDIVSTPKALQVVVPGAVDSGGGMMNEASEDQIRLNLVSNSRHQKQELRKKLESQLDLIRGLVRRIEAKEGEISRFGNSRVLINDGANNGTGMFLSGLTSPGASREVFRPSRPSHQLSVSVLENQGMSEHVEKEKRTPKANQFYRNSEFLLAKDKFPPAESNKKSKPSAKKQGGELGHGFGPGSKVFKNCSALLERLMKHKHGWVFNSPVDVKGLGLHDYFTIIKHPMDLGTIKSKLTKNWYKSPKEFAEDVRLTFHNALTYNPKGQDVHIMAEQLLKIFEDRWVAIEVDYNREMRFASDYESSLLTPRSRQALVRPPPINVLNMVDRSAYITRPVDPQLKLFSSTPSGRTPSLKKPKANEPNKRDMTYEEKQKLSLNLQNLPPEKLDQIVHIVKKRTSAVNQHNDEIEVDIDSLDPETLWELDRFITNYKKSLSKKKRRAELAIQARAEAEKNIQDKTSTAIAEEVPRRDDAAAEKNISVTLPSQPLQQGDNASRSSSSSGSTSDSSSSSSDSDSDSSSSSGSDRT